MLGQLRSRLPEVAAKVLMLTTVGRAADLHRAAAAGADGFAARLPGCLP